MRTSQPSSDAAVIRASRLDPAAFDDTTDERGIRRPSRGCDLGALEETPVGGLAQANLPR